MFKLKTKRFNVVLLAAALSCTLRFLRITCTNPPREAFEPHSHRQQIKKNIKKHKKLTRSGLRIHIISSGGGGPPSAP